MGVTEEIQGWSVTVEINAETVLTIGHNSVSGLGEFTEAQAEVIRGCAGHLRAFVGEAAGEPEAALAQAQVSCYQCKGCGDNDCAPGQCGRCKGTGIEPSPVGESEAEREAFEAWISASGRAHLLARDDPHSWYKDLNVAAFWTAWQARAALPAPAAQALVEAVPVAIPQPVLDALRFYAHGHHFNIDDDHQQFDTVSGEPQNWLMSERDDDCTMIEDGSIAKAVLLGGLPGFEEPTEPLEGEVLFATANAALAAPGWRLAMRVLQSDLYHQLDGDERAECDALVRANPYAAAQPGEQ